MTPAARLSAAIELIDTIEAQRAPAAKALKDWGATHRFAGSGDRAAIAGLVWDVLRRRASSAWIMEDETARGRCRRDRSALRRRPLCSAAAVRGGTHGAGEPHDRGGAASGCR